MLREKAMTTPLADIIRREIETAGPMTLARYMALCLGHPAHGYYMTRDPFGVAGDFITAPEISQIFGELIGAWCADLWIKNGQTSPFRIVEFGPGRGTLMADMIRVMRRVPGLYDALQVHLVEISPVLRAKQEDALAGERVTWHDHLDEVPDDGKLIIVGNEFLDALPVRQFVFHEKSWVEEVVRLDGDGTLTLGLVPADPATIADFPRMPRYPQEDDRIEISPDMNLFLKCACNRIQKQKGAALFLDYGYPQSSYGDTIQAVHKHRMVSIFDNPGEVDITAHVNFETISTIALEGGLSVHGPVTQGIFLNRLGIQERKAVLHKNATDRQKTEIENSIDRLVSYDKMGALFQVIAITSPSTPKPEGFA